MGLFDVHSHLLPGIDDSKAKWEGLEEIFRVYLDCGLDGVCFTPHLYNPHVKTDVLGIREAYARAKEMADRVGIATAIGSEVYVNDYITPRVLPIFGEFALIEFSTTYAPMDMLGKIASLKPFIPIIAHVERYSWLEPDSAVIDEMKALGCLFQVNGKALEKGGKAERYVASGIVDLFASDCHGRKEDIIALSKAFGRWPDIMKKMSRYGLTR